MAGRPLPACLATRAGWTRYLDLARRPEPHLHQIEPTNACPYACSMCTRPRMRRPVGFMDLDLFRKVMAEVAGYAPEVRALDIELFHFGESLLHPRLPEMVACASGLGLRPVLSVNPPLLRPDLAEALVRARPARIICSLDADDPDAYRRMRGPNADFDRAVAGVEALLEANRRLGAPVPVQVRLIETRLNAGQPPGFRARWADRGAEVEVRPFFPWNDPGLAGLGDWERLPPGMPCPFPWRYLVVQWNGDVVPCCRDCDGEVVLGNAGAQTLREIWNGPAYADFRRRLADPGRPAGMCGPCMDLYGTAEGGTP